MAKKSLETLTESMFYVLLALSQGDKCGTEITDFICNLTRQRVKIGPATNCCGREKTYLYTE